MPGKMLHSLGQEQLGQRLGQLSREQLNALLAQLEKYDPGLVKQQRALFLKSSVPDTTIIEPCSSFERSGNPGDFSRGEELILRGKAGCLILAGGQGTRLGVDGPKGAVPVTPILRKSLFQLFCERTKAAGIRKGQLLPLCIMTSPQNHAQTMAFFREHSDFGLEPSQLSFFQQEMLPLLNDDGQWFFDSSGKVAEGPDGNGHALHLFYRSGLWKQWRALGVEYLNVIFVDNALGDPFDPEFLGFTARNCVDAALKAVDRLSPQEKMGIPVMCRRGSTDKALKVIEYSEIPADSSQFTLSSTGMFCFSMDFIQRLCNEVKSLPLHLARKTAKTLSGEEVQVWKCERFIFDVLDYVLSSAVLVCRREHIYAPLKNATGENSLETVRQVLLLHDIG